MAEAQRPTRFGLLRLPSFRYQFLAQAATVVGGTLTPVALSFAVLRLTHSAAMLSYVLAASAVPTVVFLLVGGVWADRLPRQRLMVAANVTSAVAQLGTGLLLVSGHFVLWLVLPLQFVGGVALAFYFPAASGLTAQTVPVALVQPANALLSLTRSVAGMTGPLVASAMALSGQAGWALIVDGMLFVVSAALLSRIATPAREEPVEGSNFLSELRSGFTEVTRRGWVWSSIAVFAFSHVSSSFLLVLAPTIVFTSGRSALTWGAIVAAISVGELVGDLLALRFTPTRPILACRVVELLAVPLPFAVALGLSTPLTIALAVPAGIALTFPDAMWYTALQQHLNTNTLSRVSSFDWMGSLSLRPVGYLIAAGVAAAIGAGHALMAAAGLVLLSRVGGMLVKDVRTLRSVSSGIAAPASDPQPARG